MTARLAKEIAEHIEEATNASLMEHEFTVAQIEEALAATIREHEFETTISLLKLLALQDPDRAQTIMNAIILANEVLS